MQKSKTLLTVGDLIIQRSDKRVYSGLIYEIIEYFNDTSVFIDWPEVPPDYCPEFGYRATNITSYPRTFEVLKL
jgi:hypothetical protein